MGYNLDTNIVKTGYFIGGLMVEHLEFVNNYHDLCTEKGFQFEFVCSRCDSGYRTKFKPSITGKVSDALDSASSLFGGIFGTAANIGERVHNAAWEKAHDENFTRSSRRDQTLFHPMSALQLVGLPREMLEYEKRPLQTMRPGPWCGDGSRASLPVR